MTAIVDGTTYNAQDTAVFTISTQTAITSLLVFPGLIMTNLVPGQLITMVTNSRNIHSH